MATDMDSGLRRNDTVAGNGIVDGEDRLCPWMGRSMGNILNLAAETRRDGAAKSLRGKKLRTHAIYLCFMDREKSRIFMVW